MKLPIPGARRGQGRHGPGLPTVSFLSADGQAVEMSLALLGAPSLVSATAHFHKSDPSRSKRGFFFFREKAPSELCQHSWRAHGLVWKWVFNLGSGWGRSWEVLGAPLPQKPTQTCIFMQLYVYFVGLST